MNANRSDIVHERVMARARTYTPPNEGQGNPSWLIAGLLFIAGGVLFWVGRPNCRGSDCW